MSISATAAFLYGGCCVMFLLVVVFLFVCKIGIIDADPSIRDPPKIRIFRGRPKSVMSCTGWHVLSKTKNTSSMKTDAGSSLAQLIGSRELELLPQWLYSSSLLNTWFPNSIWEDDDDIPWKNTHTADPVTHKEVFLWREKIVFHNPIKIIVIPNCKII